MAATGVAVSDEVISQFNEVKLGRTKAKFIIYKIDGPNIVAEKLVESGSFDDFVALLPSDDCRYAIFDMDFTTNDGRPGNKLVSISWAPDTAKVKAKMVYAGSKDALTRALVGVATKVHATDLSELTETIVIDACRKFA
jgi:cofilin